jgi:hypothetical protein
MQRGGAPRNDLFNELTGPLKRRCEVDDGGALGATLQGAVCVKCGAVCKRSVIEGFLAHVSALEGDPGGGWARCPRQEEFDEHKRIAWRLDFLERNRLRMSKVKTLRSSGSTSSRGSDSSRLALPTTTPAAHDESPTPLSTLLGIGNLNVGNDPDHDPGQRTFTLDLDSRKFLDRMACMTCYEGNIAAFALGNNASYQASHDFLLQAWDQRGVPYTTPSRDFILGAGLTQAYEQFKPQCEAECNPDKESMVLTTDGWDDNNKRKILNWNHVGNRGSMFVGISECDGKHQTSEQIAEDVEAHIDANGGVKAFHQVVMDNTAANQGAWTLIEEYYDHQIICSGCLSHM